MGEREMILLMGAMIFFATTTMSINRFCLNNSQVMMESEFVYYATSLAQGIIEEAKTKKFDENIISTPTRDSTDFSYSLGRETGDVYYCDVDSNFTFNFNDVDDFNNLQFPKKANLNGSKVDFKIKVKVGYVPKSNLDSVIAGPTFHKKMTVAVSSNFMTAPDTVKLSHVFSYFEW